MTPDEKALRLKKMTLEQRLEDGFIRIGEVEVKGRDIAAWEKFWLSLLDEWESVCDQLGVET